MVSGLFTAVGSYYALKSFIGAFLQLVILALVVLAGIVIVLWIFPWTWGSSICRNSCLHCNSYTDSNYSNMDVNYIKYDK